MDALMNSTAPIHSASRSRKGKGKASEEHKKVHGKDGEMKDATLHSIGQKTRAPTSHHTKDDFRPPAMSHIKDKKLKARLASAHLSSQRAAAASEDSTILLPSASGALQPTHELERTYRVTQQEIKENVGAGVAAKMWDLDMQGGPVVANWGREGRYLALAGRKGAVSTIDFQGGKLLSEISVNETVRDITFLHNNTFHAVAQKKNVFIYDQSGIEVHRLKSHIEPTKLAYLPYHFLLLSASNSGYLKYQDTSTGVLIKEQRTGMGAVKVMEGNPFNGIAYLGHSNGTVTLWSPNVSTPLVTQLSHVGPITALSIDPSSASCGRYFATAGMDNQVKIWDARNWGQCVNSWNGRREIRDLTFSGKGMLAVGGGGTVTLFASESTTKTSCAGKTYGPEPYMVSNIPGKTVESLKFCPFEDVLGIGHSSGFKTVVVPGSGEANFDSSEADMFESGKRKSEREVRGVLEKIAADMITLDSTFIGSVAPPPKHTGPRETKKGSLPYNRLSRTEKLEVNGLVPEDEGRNDDEEEEAKGMTREEKEKHRMRGRGKTLKRFLRKKKKNVIDPTTIAIKAKLAKERDMRDREYKKSKGLLKDEGDGGALGRFKSTRTD